MTSAGSVPERGPGRHRNLAQTRAALVEAAAEVIARNGYPQASLEEIAATAGFTRGAVHHHFSSKEELLLAVMARRDEELLAGYQPDLLGLTSRPETSAARWQELHGDAPREVALRLELRSQAVRSDVLRRQLVDMEKTAVEATAAHLAKNAADHGLIWRQPPEVVAALLHAASHAAADRAALTGESSEGLMAAFMDLVWNGAFQAEDREKS